MFNEKYLEETAILEKIVMGIPANKKPQPSLQLVAGVKSIVMLRPFGGGVIQAERSAGVN